MNRRTALRGSLAASLGLVAGVAPTRAAPTLSANDRRLIELADAYEALDRRCDAHAAAHRHDHTAATDDELDLLAAGFQPIEDEIAATPADSLVGVMAKARAYQSPTARCSAEDCLLSVVDDLWRLQAAGGLAHG